MIAARWRLLSLAGLCEGVRDAKRGDISARQCITATVQPGRLTHRVAVLRRDMQARATSGTLVPTDLLIPTFGRLFGDSGPAQGLESRLEKSADWWMRPAAVRASFVADEVGTTRTVTWVRRRSSLTERSSPYRAVNWFSQLGAGGTTLGGVLNSIFGAPAR